MNEHLELIEATTRLLHDGNGCCEYGIDGCRDRDEHQLAVAQVMGFLRCSDSPLVLTAEGLVSVLPKNPGGDWDGVPLFAHVPTGRPKRAEPQDGAA